MDVLKSSYLDLAEDPAWDSTFRQGKDNLCLFCDKHPQYQPDRQFRKQMRVVDGSKDRSALVIQTQS